MTPRTAPTEALAQSTEIPHNSRWHLSLTGLKAFGTLAIDGDRYTFTSDDGAPILSSRAGFLLFVKRGIYKPVYTLTDFRNGIIPPPCLEAEADEQADDYAFENRGSTSSYTERFEAALSMGDWVVTTLGWAPVKGGGR